MAIARSVVVLWLGLLLAGCAAPGRGPAEREAAQLALFEQYAGEPVDDFHFWRLDGWETLGPDAVAVWTQPDQAWLLRVREPCNGLEFAQAIGLSSSLNRVYRSHDAVLFEQQRCRLREIRPVDGRALKAARRAQRSGD